MTKARIIYNENKILFTLIQNADGDYQVDLFLTQMREYTTSRRMALIYCREGCYLFDGNQLIQLFNYNEKDCSRLSVSELRDFSGIEVSNTEPKYYLNYFGNNNTLRSVYYHSLAVGYITQNPYNSLCWLASTAMICNYVNSTSYTLATAYAQFQSVHTTWPSTITDSPLLTGSELAGIMNDSFSLSYTYRSETLSSMRVFNNIGNYKPVLGLTGKTSTSTNYVHAIVIYGADYNLGYFSIKDPQIGTVTVVNPPNYSYYNSYFGQNLYIRKIISRY